jgi:hypothetical protein
MIPLQALAYASCFRLVSSSFFPSAEGAASFGQVTVNARTQEFILLRRFLEGRLKEFEGLLVLAQAAVEPPESVERVGTLRAGPCHHRRKPLDRLLDARSFGCAEIGEVVHGNE